jgi:hypothetical protein
MRRNPPGPYFFGNDLKSCYFETIGLMAIVLFTLPKVAKLQRSGQDKFCQRPSGGVSGMQQHGNGG